MRGFFKVHSSLEGGNLNTNRLLQLQCRSNFQVSHDSYCGLLFLTHRFHTQVWLRAELIVFIHHISASLCVSTLHEPAFLSYIRLLHVIVQGWIRQVLTILQRNIHTYILRKTAVWSDILDFFQQISPFLKLMTGLSWVDHYFCCQCFSTTQHSRWKKLFTCCRWPVCSLLLLFFPQQYYSLLLRNSRQTHLH